MTTMEIAEKATPKELGAIEDNYSGVAQATDCFFSDVSV